MGDFQVTVYNIKIIGHIIAITVFVIGNAFVHQSFNNVNGVLIFFDMPLAKIVVFDLGLLLLGISFFIEFFQSFRPLEYKKEVD